jgi:hypothetical protein
MTTICSMRRVHEGLATLMRYSDFFYEGRVCADGNEIIASGPIPSQMDEAEVRHLEKMGWTWSQMYWRFNK